MAVLKAIRQAVPEPPRLLNTAAYARVSASKFEMLQSLSAQVSYYSTYIQNHSGWLYAGVYADEALTGTKDNRPEFQRLLADCRDGKINLIVVKSVSRFARNTVTLLETVRELKKIGVDIYFEREGIHTMSAEGELLLTLIAAYAQEESLSVSENCKWRIRKAYENGIYKKNILVYGFKYSEAIGEYCIVPEEARVIQFIYDSVLAGQSIGKICKSLIAHGYPSPRGCEWSHFIVRYIIKNERNCGDMLLQKEFVSDHLSKRHKINRGELRQFYLEDTHDGIISREVFAQAQELIMERTGKYSAEKPGVRAYPFSGIITCARCGKAFARKVAHGKAAWNCGTFIRRGKVHCHGTQIPESELMRLTTQVLGLDIFDELEMKQRIHHINIPASHELEFVFHDGSIVKRSWESRSRKDGWDENARAQAREYGKKRWAYE